MQHVGRLRVLIESLAEDLAFHSPDRRETEAAGPSQHPGLHKFATLPPFAARGRVRARDRAVFPVPRHSHSKGCPIGRPNARQDLSARPRRTRSPSRP